MHYFKYKGISKFIALCVKLLWYLFVPKHVCSKITCRTVWSCVYTYYNNSPPINTVRWSWPTEVSGTVWMSGFVIQKHNSISILSNVFTCDLHNKILIYSLKDFKQQYSFLILKDTDTFSVVIRSPAAVVSALTLFPHF